MYSISGDVWALFSFPIMPPVASAHDLVPLPCDVIFSLPPWLPCVPQMPPSLFLPQDLCTCHFLCLEQFPLYSYSTAAFLDCSSPWCLPGPISSHFVGTPSLISSSLCFYQQHHLCDHSSPARMSTPRGQGFWWPHSLLCCHRLGRLLAYHRGLINGCRYVNPHVLGAVSPQTEQFPWASTRPGYSDLLFPEDFPLKCFTLFTSVSSKGNFPSVCHEWKVPGLHKGWGAP